MLRLRDGRVLARSVAERRVLARVVLSCSRDASLLAFRAADTHLPLLVALQVRLALEFARRVESGLRQRLRLAVGFAPAHAVPVEERRHLVHTFWYVLRQEQRHECSADPLYEASNLPDLLGLRVVVPGAHQAVAALLPRVGRGELWKLFGAGDLDGPVNWSLLGDAAAAALALPSVAGRSGEALLARAAALRVADGQQGLLQTASVLGVSRSALWRTRSMAQGVPAQLVQAVALQLRVRSRLLAASPGPGAAGTSRQEAPAPGR
ncbi:MAG: hypothetical protein HY744_33215 [Deltaproteobacteria bacterium]|nr:hypothetical protein [Deltaproteobacteria bacterium]